MVQALQSRKVPNHVQSNLSKPEQQGTRKIIPPKRGFRLRQGLWKTEEERNNGMNIKIYLLMKVMSPSLYGTNEIFYINTLYHKQMYNIPKVTAPYFSKVCNMCHMFDKNGL